MLSISWEHPEWRPTSVGSDQLAANRGIIAKSERR